MTTTTTNYKPGRVAWENTYTDAFPDGIPCYVLAQPGYDLGGEYPEPLMEENTARRVTAILSDADFVAYAWFGATLVEYRAAGFWNDDAEVSIVGPDANGLYAVGHGLLWETLPDVRRGLCTFQHGPKERMS